MMRAICCLPAGLFSLALCAGLAAAENAAAKKTEVRVVENPSQSPPKRSSSESPEAPDKAPAKHTLRYRFQPGESIRWEVVHRAKIETSVSGTTQTAETLSKSVKLWRVSKVEADGNATFEHLVESVDMRHKLTGRQEVHYNSQTDKKAPLGFENVAESIGVTLSVVTVDPLGAIVHRERKPVKASAQNEGQITLPLPKEPVAVGQTWSFPYQVDVPLESGGVKTVKTLQQFTLDSVKTGVATIRMVTVILTPINDPAIEALLIQRESSGAVRFDIEAGRILGQQMDLPRPGQQSPLRHPVYRRASGRRGQDRQPPQADRAGNQEVATAARDATGSTVCAC
jgi:hypothetical protein